MALPDASYEENKYTYHTFPFLLTCYAYFVKSLMLSGVSLNKCEIDYVRLYLFLFLSNNQDLTLAVISYDRCIYLFICFILQLHQIYDKYVNVSLLIANVS